jgi:4-hydroxythreonine-4-phosphate dehydrogenase
VSTRILVTIGDYNGIGPEIILKTLLLKKFTEKYDITVVSPVSVLEYYYTRMQMKAKMDFLKIISLEDKNIIIKPGMVSKHAGYISGLAVETSVKLCMNGKYDAIVTAPISKKALNLGGYCYDGHTEMLTELSAAKETAMIMLSRSLKIGFATTHPPLNKLTSLITKKRLEKKIALCIYSLKKDFRIPNASVGVLSLNPHAGDKGLIGNEEVKLINPALKKLQRKFPEIIIKGAFPSDSYFGNGIYKNFDLTFALYHDQGFIPFKMIAGNRGVNYTAGMKFVRTSPDHGTAFDIAGKFIADGKSLAEAIRMADIIHRMRNVV